MRNRLLIFLIIITGSFMWPFSCEGQTNLPCDPIYVEDPVQEAKIAKLEEDLGAVRQNVKDQAVEITQLKKDLTAELDKNDALIAQLQSANGQLETVKNDLANLQIISNTQGELITTLEKDLAECKAKPPTTVTDTVYIDKPLDYITVGGKEYKVADIELIRPFQEIDTIIVSHCDSTKLTRWYHHGGIAGYPHDISFNTKELGFVRTTFKDSLTNEIKVQPTYTLKRIKDYTKAETFYEFIK
jgi:hypothetical protein